MLEDVRRSYVQMASVVVPNWRKLDVNTLCNLYLEHEENPFERSGYFSAVLLKKWGYIGRHYVNSKASGFTIEQCYDMVCDAVLYVLNHHKWTDPENKLYGDKSAPDKCLNRCIYSVRQREYYLSNLDNRRTNFGGVSLDFIIEETGDHNEVLSDVPEDFSSDDSFSSNLVVKEIITKMFNTDKIIEALILDNIVNDDCFMERKNVNTYETEEGVKKYNTYSSDFKLGKLVNNLNGYDINTLRKICFHYSINQEKVVDFLPILTNDKNKLSRIVKAALVNLGKNKYLKESLCC